MSNWLRKIWNSANLGRRKHRVDRLSQSSMRQGKFKRSTKFTRKATPYGFLRKFTEELKKLRPERNVLIGLAIALSILCLGIPADAQQVQVTPANPRLGDTLSVMVQQQSDSSTPTIRMDGNTYKMFPIGGNRYRGFLPTTPLEAPGTRQIQIQTSEGSQNLTVNVSGRSFPTQRIRIGSGKGIEPTQYELDRVSAFKASVTPEKYWNGRFIAPNKGRLSTGYGVRRYYNGVFAKNYYHRGLDYASGTGSPVIAPAAGRVGLVGRVAQGFRLHGNIVGIDHGQGITSVFLHLSRIDVREGDTVQAGQVIGAVGATGATTGPHLHWGFYVNAKSVDPAPWLSQTME